MNKSKNNILEKSAVFALALAMLTSIVAFPASVSAETKKTTIPKSFANKEACLVKLKTYKVASLKTYGDKRIDTRLNSINNQPDKIEKAYKKYEKAEPVAKKNVLGANAVELASIGKVSQPDVAISSRKTSLLKEVSSTKSMLSTKKTALSKANTSENASEVICSVMYDLRVFSYVDKKINAQLKVDTARLKIAQNNARQKAVKKIYEKNKNDKVFAKKVKKSKVKIEALTDYQAEIDKLNNQQSRLDAISVETLNTNNEVSKADLNKIISESKQSSKDAKAEGKNIDTLYRLVKKAIAKEDAPKKTVSEDDALNTIVPRFRYFSPGELR